MISDVHQNGKRNTEKYLVNDVIHRSNIIFVL